MLGLHVCMHLFCLFVYICLLVCLFVCVRLYICLHVCVCVYIRCFVYICLLVCLCTFVACVRVYGCLFAWLIKIVFKCDDPVPILRCLCLRGGVCDVYPRHAHTHKWTVVQGSTVFHLLAVLLCRPGEPQRISLRMTGARNSP